MSGVASTAIALIGSPAYAQEQLSDHHVLPHQSSKVITQLSVSAYETPIDIEGMAGSPISKRFNAAIVGDEIASPIELAEALPLSSLAQANPTDQEPQLPSEPPSELQPFEPVPAPTSPESNLLEPETTDSAQPLEPTSEPTSPESETTDSSAAPVSSKGWQFSISPYFFAPFDINADITVSGRSTSIDLGLDDILNFDRAFTGGLRFEGQRDRWGLILDGFYLYGEDSGNLGGSFSARSLFGFVRQTSPGRLDEFVQQFDPQRLEQLTQIGQQIGQRVDLDTPIPITASGTASIRQIRVDVAVSYRAVDISLDNSPDADFYPRLTVSPLAGLRTNFLRQTIEVDTIRIAGQEIPDNAIPSVNREFRESATLVDPLLGADIELALSERWALGLQGDISGFGIGADRNLAWNLAFGAQYNISRSVGLQLLYRFNGFEYEDGDGLDRIQLDLQQNGLLLMTTFRF